MHPDLLHHVSRTIAERRPIGMAFALAALCARTTNTPLDTHLIEPLADACALCLADLTSRGEGELHLPLDGTTVLVLKIMSTQAHTYTLELVPQGVTPYLRTAWLALYPPRLTIARVSSSTEEARCAG
jgi:hypothetical protein